MHQQFIELPQPRFLRQPGSPAATGSIGRRRRVLFMGGHDAQGSMSVLSSRHYWLIRKLARICKCRPSILPDISRLKHAKRAGYGF
jgi:hypothetical protein